MTQNIKVKRLVLSLITILSLALTMPLSATSITEQTSLTPITVQLKWKHQFQFAGFYAAVAKGFYQDAGFEVTLKEASPQTVPVEEVLSGRADYGIANSELMLYRLNGEPVTAVAAIIQHSPIVLMSLKSSNILSPQDLIGKKVMYPEGYYGANTQGILLKNDIELSQIESIPLSFNINDLIDKKVDVMVGYITDQPYLLKKENIAYNLMDPRKYGIDFYGDILFTHEDRLNKKPKDLALFRAATIKGWEYAIKHPDEIIDIILTQYPSVKNKDELQYEAQETIKLIVPHLVDMGQMNPNRWKHIAETFISLKMTQGSYEKEGFIYIPEREQANQSMRMVLRTVGAISIIVLLCLTGLIYFNRKLKAAVSMQTLHLTEVNERLLSSSLQLTSKENALNTLNTELEQRIATRTNRLNEVNQTLTQEIEQGKRRELSLQLLSKAIENSSSAVLIIDDKQIISYASPAFLKLTGLQPNTLEKQSVSIIKDKLPLPNLSNIQFSHSSEDLIQCELKCTDSETVTHWLQTSISPLWAEDESISHYVLVFEDITNIKNRKDEMEKMALYDPLTGLENRVLFRTRLEQAIQNTQRGNIKTALLFIDVDNFKEVNDTLGHEAGDTVLKTIANRLLTHVRTNDTVARISGDEFTVLLNNINSYADASKVTSGILKSFQNPIHLKNSEIFITVSIGISITPDDATNIDELIKNADLAMYEAKQKGRNNLQFFSGDMNAEVKRKNTIERELRSAIDNSNFMLLYQPKVQFDNSTIVGAEALIRWEFSKDKVRNPNDFISVAEETGLIIPLGYWVVKQAIEDINVLLSKGIEHIKISINLSPRQIKDAHFVSEIRALFVSAPEYTQYFEFEITENAFIDNQPENINRLNELRDMGFSMSIDDFGTGYSSLSYLKRLPIDTIKIDRAFVMDLPGDKDNAEITSAVVAMAHKLKLSVVAEGIENKEQTHFLKSIHCDFAQGFYYGRPMTLEHLIAQVTAKALDKKD